MAKKKAAAAPSKGKRRRPPQRKKAAGSTGITAQEVAAIDPATVAALRARVEADGGIVLAAYRDPLGGHPQLFATLPIEKIEPTPFQRDLSESHVKKLSYVIDKLGRFVDPVVLVPAPGSGFWTPNGMHRLMAMRRLGAKSLVGLVIGEEKVAHNILALNTEKAHNVKEKSLEVIRMARHLALVPTPPSESELLLELEEPSFLTLGICYEQRPRFSGGAYQSILRRIDLFSDDPLPKSLPVREKRAARLLAIDDGVAEIVKKLKDKGFESPYLKAFVVARVNPVRFVKPGGEPKDFDETLGKIEANLAKFGIDNIRADQIAKSGGGSYESSDG